MPGFQHFATVVTLFLWLASGPVILFALLLRALRCLDARVTPLRARLVSQGARLKDALRAFLFDTERGGDTNAPGRSPAASRWYRNAVAASLSAMLLPARSADWFIVMLAGSVVLVMLRTRRREPVVARSVDDESEDESFADMLYRHAGYLCATALVFAATEVMLPPALVVAGARTLSLALLLAVVAGALLSGSLPVALVSAAWVEGLTGFPVAAAIPLTALALRSGVFRRRAPTPRETPAVSATPASHTVGLLAWVGYAVAISLLYAGSPGGLAGAGLVIFLVAALLLAGVSEIRSILHPRARAARSAVFTVLLPLVIVPGGVGLAGQPDLSVRLQVAQVGLRLSERYTQEFGFDRLTSLPDTGDLTLDEHNFYDVVQLLHRYPDRYTGRTVSFQGYVAANGPDGLVVARDVVWCCLEHAERVGFLLRDPPAGLAQGSWISVTAEVVPAAETNGMPVPNEVFVPARATDIHPILRPRFEFVLPF